MAFTIPLDPDELLTTTRTVRKRLDLTRPVPEDLIRGLPAGGAAGAVWLQPAGLALDRGDRRRPAARHRRGLSPVHRAVPRLRRLTCAFRSDNVSWTRARSGESASWVLRSASPSASFCWDQHFLVASIPEAYWPGTSDRTARWRLRRVYHLRARAMGSSRCCVAFST